MSGPRISRVLLFPLLATIAVGLATAQENAVDRARQIMELLSVPAEEPFTCGSYTREKGLAQELARLDGAANGAVEGVLSDVLRNGSQSRYFPASRWILLAYANSNGNAGLPFIQRFLEHGTLREFGSAALARVHNLDSIVSSDVAPVPAVSCEGPTPRTTLDAFLAAVLPESAK